jgi:hypothetical protein
VAVRVIVYFLLHITPEIIITVTKIRGSRKPYSFADYSLFKHVTCIGCGLLSNMCCIIYLAGNTNIIFLISLVY